MRKRILMTSTIGILALVLTGCSGASDEQPGDDTEQSTQAEQETEQPAEEEDGGEAGDVTAPGTELSVGDSATVIVPDTDDGEQQLEITVTDVTEAPISDFDEAGDDFLKQLEGYTPYYVSVTTTKLEPFEFEMKGDDPTDGMYAFDEDDNRLAPINMIGKFEPCDNEYMDEEHDEGEPLDSCLIFAVPDGSEFGYTAWAPNDTDFNYFDGDPIVWKP